MQIKDRKMVRQKDGLAKSGSDLRESENTDAERLDHARDQPLSKRDRTESSVAALCAGNTSRWYSCSPTQP